MTRNHSHIGGCGATIRGATLVAASAWLGSVQAQPASNRAPRVNLVEPAPWSVVDENHPIELEALASDLDGTVAGVEFLDGTVVLGRLDRPPFRWTFTPTRGLHHLVARATDNQGATSLSEGFPLGDARVDKCPADRSQVRLGVTVNGVRLPIPRVRSYSANCAMGGGSRFVGDSFRVFFRLQDIVDPRPAAAFVYVDEHPDSINDDYFALVMERSPWRGTFTDYPASHHDRAGALSIADGHAEVHPWMDARTIVPVWYLSMSLNNPSPNNPDVIWLMSRTSSLR